MRKYPFLINCLVLICSFLSCTSTEEKKSNELIFVDYSDFESALIDGNDHEKIRLDFNLLFALLLDSSQANRVYEFEPELKEIVKHYSYGVGSTKSTVGFVTQEKNIKDVLGSEFSKRMILDCTFGEQSSHVVLEIDSPVHIKGNAVIFEISTQTSTDVYHCQLLDGIVHINWLGGTME